MTATLYKGDCLELMKQIPDESVDMILCDLPYGMTRNTWDTPIPLDQLWYIYKRIIKDNGAIVLFSQQPFTAALVNNQPKLFRYEMIWHKTLATGFLNANRMPLRAHENILVFYKKLPTYNPQKTHGHKRKVSTAEHKRSSKKTTVYGAYKANTYDSTDRYPTSVMTYSTDKQKSAYHAAQKPVALCEYLIKTYTNEGETVLDNCMGSGSTGVACVNTDRNFIGMELDEKYFEIAKQRIEKTQQKEVNNGQDRNSLTGL